MAIAVFGAPYSTRTQRVLLVLKEPGLEYELKTVGLLKGEHHVRRLFHSLLSSPWFLISRTRLDTTSVGQNPCL